ncbi:MAG: TonB-dependent receptor [Pseudomonadota bacterium]
MKRVIKPILEYTSKLPAILAISGIALTLPQITVADDHERVLDEVTVTAQRREETVLEVPIAISVLDSDAISELGVSNLQDLELLIPSTTFGFDNPITIRGVGQQAWRDASAEVGVAVYQNGLFYNETYGLLESSMFDMERVEILRGPQGTLYGRNSMGGAMNLISKKPSQEFGGDLLLELTDYNGRRVGAAITGPLNDTISYRLTGSYVKRDGTAENVGSAPDAGRLDNFFFSPQLRIQTERLDLNLRYAYFDAEEGHVDQIFFSQPDTENETFIGIAGGEGALNTHFMYDTVAPSAVLFGAARYTNSVGEIQAKRVDHNRRNGRMIQRDIINIEASYTLNENWTLKYIGGRSDSETQYWHDSDFTSRVASAGNPFESADAGVPFRDGQANLSFPKEISSNEIHLQGDFENVSWLFGVYQFNETSPFRLQTYEYANEFLVTAVRGCDGTPPITRECAADFSWNIDAEVDSIATFANVDVKVNDQWTVSGGIRFSEDEKTQSRNEFVIGSFFDFGFAEEAASRTFDDWMGHLTLEYSPSEGRLIHARYARAFRAGGFNSFTFGETERVYDGETMDSLELGYKARLNDGRALASVNFYHYDYSDYQQNLSYREIINGNPVDVSDWINIDGSSITGLEIEGEVLLADNVSLRGFYAWTNSELGDLLAFNGSNPDQVWDNDGEEDFPVNPVNIGGNSFPSLAEHQFSASLVWDLNDTRLGNFSILGTYSWVGDREGSIWGIPLDEMPAYNRFDARVTWIPRNDNFEVTAFIDNILDEYGVTENEARGWDEDFIREGQLTDGRIWGFEITHSFN